MSLCSHIIHAYIHPCHGSLGRSGYVSAVPDTAKKIKKQSLFCRHPIPEPAMRHPKIVQNSPSPWHWSCSRNIHRKRSCQRNAKHKKQKTSELKIFYYALQQKKRGSSFHPPRGTFLTYETINLHQWTKPNWSKHASWPFDLCITSRYSSKGHLVPPWWWEPYDFRGSTLRSWQVFGRARKNEPWTFSTVHPFCREDSEA